MGRHWNLYIVPLESMGMITLFWYSICSMQTRGTPLILEAYLLVKPLYWQAMCTSQPKSTIFMEAA